MKGYSYLEYKNGDFPVSENLSQTIVSLPMHPYLSKQEIDSIIKELKK
jgi:UDP-2-acetamido-2-deoxy-ribo-hexuluronate aminotransferase